MIEPWINSIDMSPANWSIIQLRKKETKKKDLTQKVPWYGQLMVVMEELFITLRRTPDRHSEFGMACILNQYPSEGVFFSHTKYQTPSNLHVLGPCNTARVQTQNMGSDRIADPCFLSEQNKYIDIKTTLVSNFVEQTQIYMYSSAFSVVGTMN